MLKHDLPTLERINWEMELGDSTEFWSYGSVVENTKVENEAQEGAGERHPLACMGYK